MQHLVNPIRERPISATVADLRSAHDFLVIRATESIAGLATHPISWGVEAKRIHVNLPLEERPHLVGKDKERLIEIINIAATIERLIDALEWFGAQAEYSQLIVGECHPSTSDAAAGNDIVLATVGGQVRVRGEVCDVTTAKVGQNNKEKKEIENLGCTHGVPLDGVDRFIVTAPEFGGALTSRRRRWADLPYRYLTLQLDTPSRTQLLKLKPAQAGGPGTPTDL